MNTNLIYNNAKSGYRALAQGRIKGAVHNFSKLYKEGIKNPAQTKLLVKAGKQQAEKDALKGAFDDEFMPLVPYIKMHFLEAQIHLNKTFQDAKTNFDTAYMELYPRTHKLRDKLIDSGKVKANIG